jgi:hypothetical protein
LARGPSGTEEWKKGKCHSLALVKCEPTVVHILLISLEIKLWIVWILNYGTYSSPPETLRAVGLRMKAALSALVLLGAASFLE